jgi:Uma2 family endonuclease
MTAEELLHSHAPGKCTELVRGRLIVREPPGAAHGYIAMRIGAAILNHVDARQLGYVLAAETGFTLERNPDTVRAPDVAFVARDPVHDPPAQGYAETAPDLAVEVLSPDDRPGEVLAKVADWLNAGTRLVWVVDPRGRLTRVYRADGSEAFLTVNESLDGEEVLPGFTLPLSRVFPPT